LRSRSLERLWRFEAADAAKLTPALRVFLNRRLDLARQYRRAPHFNERPLFQEWRIAIRIEQSSIREGYLHVISTGAPHIRHPIDRPPWLQWHE
jgi:hypothetical protein